MGLLDLLRFSKGGTVQHQLPAVIEGKEARLTREDRELASLTELNGIGQSIQSAIKSSLANDPYGSHLFGDEGGYYNPEFNLLQTKARTKMLYIREPWISASASHIARTLTTVPYKVYNKKNDQIIERHPVAELINAGGEYRDELSCKWVSYLDVALTGDSFIIMDENYQTKEVVPVEMCELILDNENGKIKGVRVTGVNGRQTVSKFFDWEYVVHHKLPNPYDPWSGLSPYLAAARPILLDRYKNEFEMAFYLRGCTHSGVIETQEDLSRSRMTRMLASFEKAFTGRANWWRTIFLPKGAKWNSSSLTMADMQHLEGLRENRKTILAVLGIPGSIVGLVEDVNRATSEQQERIFWQNTVAPMAKFIAAGWNNSHLVKVKYKNEIEVRPDFAGIDAMNQSTEELKEKSDAMQPYFFIDEIREKVWGEEPLPDGLGQRLFKEVGGLGAFGAGELSFSAQMKKLVPKGHDVYSIIFDKKTFTEEQAVEWLKSHGFSHEARTEDEKSHMYLQRELGQFQEKSMRFVDLDEGVRAAIGQLKEVEDEEKAVKDRRVSMKQAATSSQNRLEKGLGRRYEKVLEAYIESVLDTARRAILDKGDVRKTLENTSEFRNNEYIKEARPILTRALDMGFSSANSQVKVFERLSEKRARFTGLSEQDKQAVDVLRAKDEDGQRQLLVERAIEAFKGFDRSQTELIMRLIDRGFEEGLTFEQIASQIRARYKESYRNQSRTIVRTEILTAVSQGLKWNHDVLGQVFTEVKKQWLHQGDEGTNPDAREDHAAFEELGEVGQNHEWQAPDGSTLSFPRDPSGSPGQIINCRCTMVSVIPDSAQSNATAILDTEI